jgi:uncharacterized protein Usg
MTIFILSSGMAKINTIMKLFDIDRLVTIEIIYYMPDYTNLVNEFVWQTHDVVPDYPRSEKFIKHWHTSIDAVIKEAYLYHSNYWGGTTYRDVSDVYEV